MVTYKQVQKIYQKVKSDIYYSNNIIYKKMIVEFESLNKMEESFKYVAKVYNGSIKEIDELLSKISIIALPKNVEKKETSDYIINSKHDTELLKSVNFFISAPIEIFLIDALWTIRIGGVIFDKGLINMKVSYGNILHNFKLYKTKSINNFNEEFEEVSNQPWFYNIPKGVSFFKPYFYQYKSWRDNAFSAIKKIVKDKQNALMVNYDIKQFYYNYRVSFDEISAYITSSHLYETKLIELIYSRYQEILLMYKNLDVIKGRYPLPIGLFSSRVLSNVALSRYDAKMFRIADSYNGFYGRYVDDMYFVIPLEVDANQKKEKVIDSLISQYHFLEKENSDCRVPQEDLMLDFFADYIESGIYSKLPSLKINSKKMDLYVFYHNEPNILSKIYDAKMLMSVSDVGYSIDFDYNEKSLFSDLFKYKDSKYGFKISDLKTTILDKYELSLTLTKLINFYKNISIEENDEKIEKIQKSICDLFSNLNAIKFYQYYEKLFILLSLLGHSYISKMKYTISKVIEEQIKENFSIDEYVENEKVLLLVKENLKKCLNYSYEEGLSLIFEPASVKEEQINSIKWLQSLMINKRLYLSPLIQLSKENINIYNMKRFYFEYELDKEKLKYIPYWISFQEFYFYKQLMALKENQYLNFDKIMEEYFKINNTNKSEIYSQSNFSYEIDFYSHTFLEKKKNFYVVNLLNQPKSSKRGIDETDEDFFERVLEDWYEQERDYSIFKIGVVSIPLQIDELFKAFKNYGYIYDITYKMQINHVLNEAIRYKVNHIIFPELSIPPIWVNDIISYGLRHNIQITFGMQYLYDSNRRIYNTIMSIYPFTICGVYNFAYISLREKRYYPYSEKAFFEMNGLKYKENPNLKQEIVHYRGGKFTNFLCYELTSISDRAILKNQVNVLFVPVLNRDTNYFSSIVDSTARELFCYVSMANTSLYGDSRITGPFSTNEKDIVRLKGGNNIFCVVGEIYLNELESKRKKTNNEHFEKAKDDLKKNQKSECERKYKPLSAGSVPDITEKPDFIDDKLL